MIKKRKYTPKAIEKIFAYSIAAIIVFVSMFLVIRNEPFSDPNLVVIIRILLVAGLGILGGLIPGFLNINWSYRGMIIKAGGAFALAFITYQMTPEVLGTYRNVFPLSMDTQNRTQRENSLQAFNNILVRNQEIKNIYLNSSSTAVFIHTWTQFFEKGRIIYNISNGYALVLSGETRAFNTFPTEEALITSGRGMLNIHWDKVNILLEDVPEKHKEKYIDLVETHSIVGGIGTLYLKERLYSKLGKPLNSEFTEDDILSVTFDNYFILSGVKNRDGDEDDENFGVYIFNDSKNTFEKFYGRL